MNRDPKQHPFTPIRPGGAQCKWCPFHKNAHIETNEDVDWVCVKCDCVVTEEDVYCPRCAHNYFKPKVKGPSNG